MLLLNALPLIKQAYHSLNHVYLGRLIHTWSMEIARLLSCDSHLVMDPVQAGNGPRLAMVPGWHWSQAAVGPRSMLPYEMESDLLVNSTLLLLCNSNIPTSLSCLS